VDDTDMTVIVLGFPYDKLMVSIVDQFSQGDLPVEVAITTMLEVGDYR